jgi:hypothetical protein
MNSTTTGAGFIFNHRNSTNTPADLSSLDKFQMLSHVELIKERNGARPQTGKPGEINFHPLGGLDKYAPPATSTLK